VTAIAGETQARKRSCSAERDAVYTDPALGAPIAGKADYSRYLEPLKGNGLLRRFGGVRAAAGTPGRLYITRPIVTYPHQGVVSAGLPGTSAEGTLARPTTSC
jgi:hypothetical protein